MYVGHCFVSIYSVLLKQFEASNKSWQLITLNTRKWWKAINIDNRIYRVQHTKTITAYQKSIKFQKVGHFHCTAKIYVSVLKKLNRCILVISKVEWDPLSRIDVRTDVVYSNAKHLQASLTKPEIFCIWLPRIPPVNNPMIDTPVSGNHLLKEPSWCLVIGIKLRGVLYHMLNCQVKPVLLTTLITEHLPKETNLVDCKCLLNRRSNTCGAQNAWSIISSCTIPRSASFS